MKNIKNDNEKGFLLHEAYLNCCINSKKFTFGTLAGGKGYPALINEQKKKNTKCQ